MKTLTIPFISNKKLTVLISLMALFSGLSLNAQTSYIYVYSPYYGQVTYQNTPVDITWFTYGADTVNIEYSLDSGSTWNVVTDNYSGYYYQWITPNAISDQCYIRITSSDDPTLFGEAGPFSIVETPTLTLLSPNGGETWNYGETATISWTGTNLPYYLYLDYSTDGGLNWAGLGSGYSEPTGGTAEVYVPFLTSDNVLVKIYDPYYPEMIFDISDQPFSIYTPPVIVTYPYEGDVFYLNSQTYLSWIASGVDSVNIDLSTDGGLTYDPIVQNLSASFGYYQWNISGTPSQSCIIKISDASDPSKFGLSGTFTLLATPVITLTSPVGGEILNTNQSYSISWEYDQPSSTYIYLEYSMDDGLNWNYLAYAMNTGSTGSYDWITPVMESEKYRIRISDYYMNFVNDASNSFSVISFPETSICIVTVDSISKKNLIVWEKPISPLISEFIVYKESGSADIYEPIGSVAYNEISAFTDTSSNPAMKSYRYRLGFSNQAGYVFPAGNFHQTIHLAINQGVENTWNLIWTDYLGFEVGSYNIYRGSSSSNMSQIASISASFSSFTDLDAPAGTVYYMIEVLNSAGCNPFKAGNYGSTRSNIATNNTFGSTDHEIVPEVTVSPNPANELLKVSIGYPDSGTPVSLRLYNTEGKECYRYESSDSQKEYLIPVNNLPVGFYMLSVAKTDQIITQKVVIRR